MLFPDLYKLIGDAKNENGKCFLNGTKLNFYEGAFLNYYYIKFENTDFSKSFIEDTAASAAGSGNFHKSAFWLWLIGEYLNKTSDSEFLNKHIENINEACRVIENNWDKEMTHWLMHGEKGYFAANLALAYGALTSIFNSIESEYQRLTVEIRRFFFKKFMNGGSIVSKIGSSINGDLSVVSVPFGLLDAGNQIMVESMNILEKKLVKDRVSYDGTLAEMDDLTLLLSWYYAERGEIAKAKKFLNNVYKCMDNIYSETDGDKKDYFAYILFAIAEKEIDSKCFQESPSGGINIKHIPCGFQNPYRKTNY